MKRRRPIPLTYDSKCTRCVEGLVHSFRYVNVIMRDPEGQPSHMVRALDVQDLCFCVRPAAREPAPCDHLAEVLNLQLPEHIDPVRAIEMDIRRLLDTEKRWSQACEIAAAHCPVGDGESHVRQGIPRLAAEVQRLRADLEIAESRKSNVIQRLSAFARECRDNWDCDADAHTHETLCRACEAGRVLTYAEEPR